MDLDNILECPQCGRLRREQDDSCACGSDYGDIDLRPSKVPSVSEAAKARADVLRTLRVAQRAVRDDFVYAVEYARMQGVSWREVEKQAGMSRQQMHKLKETL